VELIYTPIYANCTGIALVTLEKSGEQSNHHKESESGNVSGRGTDLHHLRLYGPNGSGGGRGNALVGSGASWAALGECGIKVEVLLQPGELVRVGSGAELGGGQGILHTKHSLTLLDEVAEDGALVKLEALLVDGEVEIVHERSDLVDVVLEGNSQIVSVCGLSKEGVEAELIGSGDGETRVVLVRVNVVHLNSIATLGGSHLNTGGHDVANHRGPDVNPELAGPSVDTVALDSSGELGRVGSAGLVGGVDVTGHGTACSMEAVDQGLRGVEHVDIVHLHINGGVNLAR